MRPAPALATLGLALCLMAGGCDRHAADRAELASMVADLSRAGAAPDARFLTASFTPETIERYDALIPVILDAPREQIERLPPALQRLVLLARLESTRTDLAELDGTTLLARAITSGWWILAPAHQITLSIGDLEFPSADGAWATILADARPTGVRLHFLRFGGPWRIDEPATVRAMSDAWFDDARDRRVGWSQYILDRVAEAHAGPAPESLWDPMPP